MNSLQLFLMSRFTANARNIAMLIAICLSAYGLTILNWLETKHQKAVELSPRKETPDFLITQARYLHYQPSITDEEPSLKIGKLRYDIASKLLIHSLSRNETEFTQPKIEYLNQNQAWLITAEKAIAKMEKKQGVEENILLLEDDVNFKDLTGSNLAINTPSLAVNLSQETLQTKSPIKIEITNGQLQAGGLTSDIKQGKLFLTDKVKATYNLK